MACLPHADPVAWPELARRQSLRQALAAVMCSGEQQYPPLTTASLPFLTVNNDNPPPHLLD